MTEWLTGAEDPVVLRAYWPNVDELDPDALLAVFTAARVACETFAPQLEDGAPVPEPWRLAQAMQARALYRSGAAGSGDRLGLEDGPSVTVFPLDWTVKSLLRPKRGAPVIA